MGVPELRVSLHMTVGELKEKLYRHVGTRPHDQALVLKSGGQPIALLDNDNAKLGFYGCQNGMNVEVKDLNPNSLAATGWLENEKLVKKYEISEEDYDKRKNTVRSYKREQLAKDPNWKPPVLPGAGARPTIIPGADTVKHATIGARCEVQPGSRRGTVGYVGQVEGLAGGGHWIGVRFDEPVGKSDGTCKGKRFFECGAGYGAFVRGKNVEIGDFPEKSIFDGLDDSDEDEI